MDPAGQLRAFREMEELGLELLGIFHSHPAGNRGGDTGPEGPSDTDAREAAYQAVHVIWSQHSGTWRARGFWIEGERISEVPLVVSAAE
jgi:proteasome lid subunit RPN8/RPN11